MGDNASLCDFVVSFISVGAGVNHEAHDAFSAYLKSLNDKVAFELEHWGMEGEVDYCINIVESDEDKRNEIRSKLKALLDDRKLVSYKMDSAWSRHNKRTRP